MLGVRDKMKAKDKFRDIFVRLPEEARAELVYNYGVNPMSLNVVLMEINADTKLGKKALKELGFKDD